MSNKQKFYLLYLLVVVASAMLVYRITQVVISLEKSGYISLPKFQTQPIQNEVQPTLVQISDASGIDIEDYQEAKGVKSSLELSLLEDLAFQREALEIKALELEKRDLQLQLVAIELNNKMDVLERAEARITDLLEKRDQQQQAEISDLVQLYTNMNSKDATRIIETLETEVAILLLKSMDSDLAASILAQMDADKAKAITNKIIEPSILRKN